MKLDMNVRELNHRLWDGPGTGENSRDDKLSGISREHTPVNKGGDAATYERYLKYLEKKHAFIPPAFPDLTAALPMEIIEEDLEEELEEEPISPGSEQDFYPNGLPKRAILFEDTEIAGITYAGGTEIIFYENGKVEQGILAKGEDNTLIKGVECPAGTEVVFYESGKLKLVVSPRDILIPTQENSVKCRAKEIVAFYESEKLLSIVPAEDATFQGIKCPAGTRIYFYENGKLDQS